MDIEQVPNSLFCKFVTSLPETYQVDDTPIEIQADYNQENLNEIISHLLDQEDLRFEFLVNGEFLRGNLKSHIIKHEIDTEKTIEIQYSLSIQKPELDTQLPEDDWVSSLSSFNNNFASGLFSGKISFYQNKSKSNETSLSNKPIKSVKLFEDFVYAGGLDSKVRVLRNQNNGLTPMYQLDGSNSSIESLDTNPLDYRFVCAGTQDHSLLIWKLPNLSQEDGQKIKKKVKADFKPIDLLSLNKIHGDVVSTVNWAETELILTGSYDHTVKLFDVNSKKETQSISLRDSICSSMDKRKQTLITGQENGTVKIWDLNQRDKGAQKSFKSHQVWVSQIKFHPLNEFLFATCSFDSNIKIWDMRCSYPLFTLKGSLKQFALEWYGEDEILSGGQDKQISVHKFQQ